MSSEKSDESDTLFPRLLGIPVERTVRARELVNLMATSLVEDLRNLGLNAYRLTANNPAAVNGWLVRGTFIRIDEGNRIRRALVGFGDGETQLEVLTSLSDLTSGARGPFCELGTRARSSTGAGAIISFDPFEALGRFMTCGLDLDKNVMETAGRIAKEIARTIKSVPQSASVPARGEMARLRRPDSPPTIIIARRSPLRARPGERPPRS